MKKTTRTRITEKNIYHENDAATDDNFNNRNINCNNNTNNIDNDK